jgi:hypothetical protein
VKLPDVRRIWRCPYCGRALNRESTARLENPFCERCLADRLETGARTLGPVTWGEDGEYLVPSRVDQKSGGDGGRLQDQ